MWHRINSFVVHKRTDLSFERHSPEKTIMESHKCKSKKKVHYFLLLNIYVDFVVNKQQIMRAVLLIERLQKMLNLIKTFTNIRLTMPTRAVCLSTEEISTKFNLALWADEWRWRLPLCFVTIGKTLFLSVCSQSLWFPGTYSAVHTYS